MIGDERLPAFFWSRVEVDDASGCHLWTGATNGKGYGLTKVGQRRLVVHRFAYETLIGPVPAGLVLDHLCNTRRCVNLGHLQTVTNKVNVLRGVGITAENARKSACKAGHAFEGRNLIVRPGGWRGCRICKNASTYASHKAIRARGNNSPAYCAVHQHYKWCGHNGGVMGPNGWRQP